VHRNLLSLTVKLYVAVHVAPRIFGDALIVAIIAALNISDRQSHGRLVRWVPCNRFGSKSREAKLLA